MQPRHSEASANSSNFRSRLAKPAPMLEQLPDRDPSEELPDFKEHFHALVEEIFDENGKLDMTDEAYAGLADAFASASFKLRQTAKTAIDQAHQAIEDRIQKFTSDYSTEFTQAQALYENISYPLAVTRCLSTKRNSATISKYLAELQLLLEQGESELDALHKDWTDTWEEEGKLRDQLDSDSDDEDAVAEFEALDADIEATTNTMLAKLDEIDDEYTEKLQNASTAMMESIMEE